MFTTVIRGQFVVRCTSAFIFLASLLSFANHLHADDTMTSPSSLPVALVASKVTDSVSTFSLPADMSSPMNNTSTVVRELSSAAVCSLAPLDPFQHAIIDDLVAEQRLNLIQYTLLFPNSSVNPLTVNLTRIFKGNSFSRVSSLQGQTLLSLAFNYGILSLMTLTIGTDEQKVDLVEHPTGCMLRLTEEEKIRMVVELLMRDFKTTPGSNITFRGEERVCYEVVTDNGNGYARFTDHCWFRDRIHGNTVSDTQYANGWLTFLYVMLTCIRFGVLAFGPLMFLSTVSGLIREEFPYTVKLKDPLVKTIVVYRTDTPNSGGIGQPLPAVEELKGRHKLDLRQQRGYPKLWETIMNNRELIGRPFRAKFTQYDILVSYKRLLTENKVPVGFWHSIVSSVFFCKLRHVGPFQRCCRADVLREPNCRKAAESCCGRSAVRHPIQWIQLWRRVGLALLIVLLPTPYYIRLFILYYFEYDEVIARKDAARRLGLREYFENSLVHYFLPTSPLFIVIYVVYAVMAFNLAYLARHNDKGRFRKIIIGSFTDLKSLSWINVLQMMVSNVIWPFQRFGLAGCLVVIVYWPIVLPLTSLVYAFYCLPTVYLTVRMFFYSKMAFLRRIKKRSVKRFYQVKHQVDDSVQYFEAGYLLGNGSDEEDESTSSRSDKAMKLDEEAATGDHRRSTKAKSVLRATSRFWSIRESVLNSEELDDVTNINTDKVPTAKRSVSNASSTVIDLIHGSRVKRVVEHCLASALCVAALYSTLVVLSECVGCFVEILVFTLMGIIVNAGTLLKYVALVVMLIVYSYDCFNNVEKKYLKLNRALFSEVKSRVKDLDKVTSLPSFLQENCGFKSQELGEQADYELSDDLADKPARHWLINDLVLFIDNEDMPRIPRKLFEDVCRIRVAGVPGPVYRGQLLALRQFLRIVVFIFFVFVVILSFGSFVKVSSTNQMIAALAGGSLPFILRMVMEPEKPDIEIGTVSFKNQLDEVIKNFVQYWPIYDLPFELYTAEDEERDRQKAEENLKKDGRSESIATLQRMPGNLSASFERELLRKPLIREDEMLVINNNSNDCVDAVGNHVITATVQRETTGTAEAEGPVRPISRVCFGGELNDQTGSDEPDVDIVVYLPLKHDGVWLDQWSDLDGDLEQPDEQPYASSGDEADVFELNNLKRTERHSSSLPCIEKVDRPPVSAGRFGRTLERC